MQKTLCPIRILNVPFDTTPAQLAKLLGTPKSKRTETDHPAYTRTTFFYRRPFFQSKAIFQFNFFNEVFTSCVVTFIQKESPVELLFLQIIREKYLLSTDKAQKTFDGIIDGAGNLIIYEESVYSSLVYVSAGAVHKNIQHEVDEKLKLIDLMHWEKHYDRWSENL